MSFGIYNAFIFDRNYTMQELIKMMDSLKKEVEYNLRVGDYCKIVLDREDPTHWIFGIIVKINEEENSFSIKDSDGDIIKIECDHIHNIYSKEELQILMKGKRIK